MLQKTFYCNDHTITEFGIIDRKNSSTAYVILYELIDTWFLDTNRRVGVWSLPWCVEEQAPKPVGWMMCFLLMTFVSVQKLCVDIYIYIYILVTFGICFKQPFDTKYLVFYNPSPPRIFLSLDLFSEYRIQHGAIGPLYVTSSYSTWIICRGVSGFATDCPCDVWCRRGLTTCLLHVGPPFENRFLNTSWAVGLTYWIVYLHFFLYFGKCNYICLDTSYQFWLYLYFLNILYFFKYSCTNIFHRRSLCTFYMNRYNAKYLLIYHTCW